MALSDNANGSKESFQAKILSYGDIYQIIASNKALPHRSIALNTGWRYKAQGQVAQLPSDSWQPSQELPTSIYLDLMANGVIPDPFPAKNEDEVQWVGNQVWIYMTEFSVPEDVAPDSNIKVHLVFGGLDTYATVRLNDKVILESENAFLGHRIDISEHVKDSKGPFGLGITFDNTELRGDAEVAQHPEHRWLTFNSGAGRLAVRAPQYHRGWDWGPKLLACGPWKPIHLEVFESRIKDLAIRSTLNDGIDEATFNIDIDVEGKASYAVVDVSHQGRPAASHLVRLGTDQTGSVDFKLKRPQLWWPHTFGKQNMYDVTATIFERGKPSHTTTKRIGIRKIELVRQPLADEEGSSFFLRVNNVPIFSVGSNWIPSDMFSSRITPKSYRDWLQLARDSNQVMIRVWGGGIYEPHSFYNACDELGLLIWQDFMFACGLFPAYPEFCKTVELEVDDNLRNLRHHPSIALWCGNNEDYVIPLLSKMEYDHNETDPEAMLKSVFPARYIYEHLFPKACAKLVPDTPYWPGSPFGGDMINSVLEGDCHQWHVWHLEKFPYQDFPRLKARFVSEFGMQGMPTMRTVREFFPADVTYLDDKRDWPEDPYIQYHNKCGGGPETLHQYCADNVEFDTTNLRQFVYYTQLIQSETVSTAYKSWRRLWRGPGKEYCGGALLWQLNDCYPVTSWSLADYKLRPKMAYWAMKRENKPVSAGLHRTNDAGSSKVEAWAVNTALQDVTVDIQLDAWRVSGGKKLHSEAMHTGLTLKANQSTELGVVDFQTLSLPDSTDFRNIVVSLQVFATKTSPSPDEAGKILQTGSVIAQNINFHEPLKEVSFASPSSVIVRISSRDGHNWLDFTSDVALKGVLIDLQDSEVNADEVRFDDNGLDITPGQTVHVGVIGLEPGDESRLKIYWLGGEWTGP